MIQISSFDELLLQRIDDLDDFTRKTLQVSSVLGLTFSLFEVTKVSEYVLSISENEKNYHKERIRSSLVIAMEEGILDESSAKLDQFHFQIENYSFSTFPDSTKQKERNIKTYENEDSNITYRFCHDTWRQKILGLLLGSYKRDIHIHAANIIELYTSDIKNSDYRTKMKLFVHLKHSGNTLKAANLALDIGKNFKHLGLNEHSIHVYNEALDMWRKGTVNNAQKSNSMAGISINDIKSLHQSDLTSIIKLLTALGQAIGTMSKRESESAKVFEDALKVSESCI